MEMLPDLRIPRVLPGLRVKMYAKKTLPAIPPKENFCAAMISTRSRLPEDLQERAGWVHNILEVAFPLNFASVELAVAMLNEEAAHFGWRFLVPMNGTQFEKLASPAFVTVNHPDARAALAELEEVTSRGDAAWRNHMQDIGARGRQEEFMAFADKPQGFALGIRLQPVLVDGKLQQVSSR